jgi:opine dehydrogenase
LKSVAVLGAGNGGCSAAADLTLRGFHVNLYDFKDKRLRPVWEKGGIELLGVAGEGFAEMKATANIGEAVEDADLIMIVFPAPAHRIFAEKLAPHIRDGQMIVLNPGSTGGALCFAEALKELGVMKRVTLCETNTLTYVCRLIEPGKAKVFHVSKDVLFASFPGANVDAAHEGFKELYPSATKAENVLETSIFNPNAIVHPPMMILNSGWIEDTGGDFKFYYEGSNPKVANVIQKVDEERMRLAEVLNIRTPSFIEFFYKAGYTSKRALKEKSMYYALRDSEVNRDIRAPSKLQHRFMEEDVEFGLVPFSSLGREYGAATPTIDSLICLASTINHTDYWKKGATVNKMGVAGLSLEELRDFLHLGNV